MTVEWCINVQAFPIATWSSSVSVTCITGETTDATCSLNLRAGRPASHSVRQCCSGSLGLFSHWSSPLSTPATQLWTRVSEESTPCQCTELARDYGTCKMKWHRQNTDILCLSAVYTMHFIWVDILAFLALVGRPCYCEHPFSPSVCPSVRHTHGPHLNSARYRNALCTTR